MNWKRRMMIMDTIYTVAGIMAVSSVMATMIWGIIWLLSS